MKSRYILEIYSPDSKETKVEATFESDTPFMNISYGDILNPGMWSGYPNKEFRVVKLVHDILQVGNVIKHKIGVHTTIKGASEEMKEINKIIDKADRKNGFMDTGKQKPKKWSPFEDEEDELI